MKANFVLTGDFGVVSNAMMTQDKANELNAEMSRTEDYRFWVWLKA